MQNGEVVELIKFCRLAASGSPNQIEYLYSKYATPLTSEGEFLLRHRHCFLSKKMVPRYIGFLKGNLKRYDGDPKAQVQAFRLTVTCLNLLRTGSLDIQINGDNLKIVDKIRGGFSIVSLLENEWLPQIREAEDASTLRDEPDYGVINEMILSIRLSKYYL